MRNIFFITRARTVVDTSEYTVLCHHRVSTGGPCPAIRFAANKHRAENKSKNQARLQSVGSSRELVSLLSSSLALRLLAPAYT